MQQYPEILPVHAEFRANLIFIAVFQKNPFQQLAVAFAELVQDLAHCLLRVLRNHRVKNIRVLCLNIDL